jgi:signal transduction histidine kinase/ActR/RegA family two-component response regulator
MTKTMIDPAELRLLIYTPFGKDAELACNALRSADFSCLVCKTLPELWQEVGKGAGAILSVEEALPMNIAPTPLDDYLANQPAWSDLPILVLTKPGGESPWINGAYDRLGNLTLLERPVRAPTLISAARSALRARQRQYEMRLADQRKDEFLAMLAHELRNPLAPISAAAQLMQLISSDSDRVRQTSAVISRQVGHMTNLIDDLLDVARVTRGMVTLDKEPLDIRDILSEAVEQGTPLIRARRHHLALHLPPDPALVFGDRKRLVQVIANMLNNASKYTPEEGNVIARLQVLTDEVVLTISDTGIGMAPEMVSRVFDLFAQAERTSDRSQGGLGLGLALVKNLVESHGGSVHANSEGLGTGSAFTVRLPRMLSEPAGVTDTPAANQTVFHTSQPLRLLVVDDNADAANILEMFLDAAGHKVSVEYAANSAIERAKSVLPQVCLLDIGLPDMDGCELARHLREQPETANSVLIAITGYGQDQDRKRTLQAGFDHHFVKPVDTARLTAILAQISPL